MKKEKKVIGISGGIASGKSQVSAYIKNKGYQVFDCDNISHYIFEKEEVKKEISARFNIDIKDVNRKNIASIVFNNKELLNVLNDIMRKRIIDEMKAIILKHEDIIFFDVPLLYDWALNDMFDKVIFVYVNKETQIERLKNRDSIDNNYANNKIKAQIDIDKKLEIAKERCDIIIDNNSNIDDLYLKIDEVLKEIEDEI